MYRLNMLSMQENSEADRRQRREEAQQRREEANKRAQEQREEAEQRRKEIRANHKGDREANRQLFEFIGTVMTSVASMWALGNKRASLLLRPNQEPVIGVASAPEEKKKRSHQPLKD